MQRCQIAFVDFEKFLLLLNDGQNADLAESVGFPGQFQVFFKLGDYVDPVQAKHRVSVLNPCVGGFDFPLNAPDGGG